MPALRRHRFAGGGLADDEAWLPGPLCSLSQVSSSGPVVHRKSCRADPPSDPASIYLQLDPGALGRHTENYHRVHSTRVPGDTLPAVHVANCPGLGRAWGAKATITGESCGQVSSQTLDNIAAIDQVADIPVLRPLIGFNKEEIVNMARAIGTFPISIQPDQDCCRLVRATASRDACATRFGVQDGVWPACR